MLLTMRAYKEALRGLLYYNAYQLDLERDLAWLGGATISDVQTTREETLSGQGVTMVRFKWRPAGSNSLPEDAVLRVKTERWLAVTYIRTVEVVRAAP